jgi:hypothetical protein
MRKVKRHVPTLPCRRPLCCLPPLCCPPPCCLQLCCLICCCCRRAACLAATPAPRRPAGHPGHNALGRRHGFHGASQRRLQQRPAGVLSRQRVVGLHHEQEEELQKGGEGNRRATTAGSSAWMWPLWLRLGAGRVPSGAVALHQPASPTSRRESPPAPASNRQQPPATASTHRIPTAPADSPADVDRGEEPAAGLGQHKRIGRQIEHLQAEGKQGRRAGQAQQARQTDGQSTQSRAGRQAGEVYEHRQRGRVSKDASMWALERRQGLPSLVHPVCTQPASSQATQAAPPDSWNPSAPCPLPPG